MKDVLISVRPQWVEKIASRECTILVRKARPKLETPFKCYIYCTNGTQLLDIRKERIYLDTNKSFLLTNGKSNKVICSTPPQANRKISGEFICDRIICSQAYFDSQGKNHLTNIFAEDIKKTCLTEYELWNYIAGKAVKANEMYDGWLWHISDLKIYDSPKELSEFYKGCNDSDDPMYGSYCSCCEKKNKLTRPPQSWCYVEGAK